MGVPTVTATRILKGQLEGHLGPETPLAMDHFPYMALSKVRTLEHLECEEEADGDPGQGWQRESTAPQAWVKK